MKRLVVLLALIATPAFAQQRNGSAMLDGSPVTITARGDELEIKYIEPPPLLRELGVQRGATVLSGIWAEGVLVGDAYMYAPNCPPISYPVRGVVDAYSNLVVIGPTPKLSGCTVTGYEWTPKSVFKLGRPEQPKAKKLKAKPKPSKPKAKPRPRAAPVQQPQQWWW